MSLLAKRKAKLKNNMGQKWIRKNQNDRFGTISALLLLNLNKSLKKKILIEER